MTSEKDEWARREAWRQWSRRATLKLLLGKEVAWRSGPVGGALKR